jgi:hypothetical protein
MIKNEVELKNAKFREKKLKKKVCFHVFRKKKIYAFIWILKFRNNFNIFLCSKAHRK